MKTHIKLLFAFLFAGLSTAQAQINLPIILMQKLSTAPTTIVVAGTYDISVVVDTANYIDIRTSGTIADADSLRFPEGKITLSNNGTMLKFNKEFPYRSGIRVHTTAKTLTLLAKEYSKVSLTSLSGGEIQLKTLTLNSENGSIITVDNIVKTDEAYIDAKDFGWIRYRTIEAKNKKVNAYGAGRIIEIGGGVEESLFSTLVADKRKTPFYLDYTFGVSSLGTTPFGGFNSPSGNFVWGCKPFNYFSFSSRWAFFQKSHWEISAGFSMSLYSLHADNAYLDIVHDTLSQTASLEAVDASALFATEEAQHGKILWNSDFQTASIVIPIHIEWHARGDYKGAHIGAELRPSITYYRKRSRLIRHGFYMSENSIATSINEDIGKYINPMRLDIRLNVGYNRFNLFAETSLTPLFRITTENPATKPALAQKAYPFSIGVNLSF